MKPIYKTMIISLLVNSFLVILKLIVGLIFNLQTLIADSVHSLSDMMTDIIAIIGQKISKSESDNSHPYGHGKIEYITSIVIGSIIMILGLSLIYHAVNMKINVTIYNNIVVGVVLLIIISKYSLSQYVIRNAKKYKSNILMASGKENLADVLSSVAVLITVLLYKLSSYVSIFKYADKLGCIIISLFIIKTAFQILKDNIITLLGERENDELVIKETKNLIYEVEGIKEIDELILMKYGSYYNTSLKISVDANSSLRESHQIAHAVETKLLENNRKIKYVIVHINPYEKNISS
ncbi:MAG: cation diffusion facilitator family transporter [Bacilli bacterium]|nr:cation diffusion facilitator family transporter [Bacilli bacterium]